MTLQQGGRYRASTSPQVADGWILKRLTPVSHMYGANGVRGGPDGRLYVAECVGSRVSAVNVDSGAAEVISPLGGDIVSPDDVDFDAHGNMYVTEFMDARVSVRGTGGRTRILRDDLPGANGITFHQGRLFIDECRLGGRLLELDLNGGAPRVVAENLQLPNALSPGPDGFLYFPQVVASEIWRIHPDGGPPERVVADLGRAGQGRIHEGVPVEEGTRVTDQAAGRARPCHRLVALPPRVVQLGEQLGIGHRVETVAQPPAELPDSAAVRRKVADDPEAIGYIERGALDGSVRAVLVVQ